MSEQPTPQNERPSIPGLGGASANSSPLDQQTKPYAQRLLELFKQSTQSGNLARGQERFDNNKK